VEADPVRAFEVFTAIDRWWPLAVRSVLGSAATVGFVDGQLVERSAVGETAIWGKVTRWEPGVAVELTWHPGRPRERASQLTVTFAATESKTQVTLQHSGWDGYDDPVAARDDYNKGWPRMLGLFHHEARAGLGVET
jgi:hypothetical protein